jgi:GH24 family phage-related lysozyme (muramidase)
MDLRAKIATGLALLASIGGIVGYTKAMEGDGPSKVVAQQRVYVAYADPGKGWGLPTICNGHTRGVTRTTTATQAQCDKWLTEDLAIAAADATPCMRRTDQPGPLWAFTDLQYNPGGACASAAMRAYNAGDCKRATWELFGAPQIGPDGKPRIWDGTRIVGGRAVRLKTPLTYQGRVFLRVGEPIPKWTTGGGIPLPGLFIRAENRAKKMQEGCKP